MRDGDRDQGRRQHERQAVDLTARLSIENRSRIDGHVANIGEGGAFFLTDDLETLVAERARVSLRVDRFDRDPLNVTGSVLRIDMDFDGDRIVRSLAVRFDEVLPLEELPGEGSAES